MKFLIDESLSATVARTLEAAGHDAIHVGAVGLLGAPDTDVMSAATTEDRIVVSADTDFGEILALGRHPGPSTAEDLSYARSQRKIRQGGGCSARPLGF